MPASTPGAGQALPSSVLVQTAGKSRKYAIQSGFVGRSCPIVPFGHVGFRPFGASPDPAVLDTALSSGRAGGGSGLRRVLKRQVLTGQFRWFDALLDRNPGAALAVWNGTKGHRKLIAHAAEARGRRVFYFEEAPLPGRLYVDTRGVSYGSSVPREPLFYGAWAAGQDLAPDAWRAVGEHMVPRAAERGSLVGQGAAAEGLGAEPYLFVPLQVPGDSQVTVYGDWVDSIPGFVAALDRVSAALPEGWHIRLKEHPSAPTVLGGSFRPRDPSRFRIDNETNTFEQVRLSRGVITINSSVGLQAFFFDKPVIATGLAFFAFGGLAEKAVSEDHLREIISAPEALTFDAGLRDVFMTYLDREYFPTEADVTEGRFGIPELIARDARAAAILASL